MWVFPTKQFSRTSTGCTTIYLNSNSIYPEKSRSHGLRAQSHPLLLPQVVSPQVTRNLYQIQLLIKGSHDPDLLDAAHRTQGNSFTSLLKDMIGTSLVVQWLRLCPLNAGGLGAIPGEGTRSHMLQLRVNMPQLRPSMPQLRPGAAK